MARKKTIKDVDLKEKRVIVRVDFNVPLNDNLEITDDLRIQAALPTIKYLIDEKARIILMSHLGRPKGKIQEKMRLKPVHQALQKLLAVNVKMAPDCIGSEVEKLASDLAPTDILLLENLRFHPEEKANDPEFAKKLASLADVYVNDAFGTAHRSHASTEGITRFISPAVTGFLLMKEIDYLKNAIENPEHPFIAILGGAKVSDKILLIDRLMDKVDAILIGGGMAFTFLAAKGLEIGKSILEKENIDVAKEILKKASKQNKTIIFPVDVVIADEFSASANTQIVSVDAIPSEWMGLDIGPKSADIFVEWVEKARMVLWNGPVGVFEFSPFMKGTEKIAQALAKSQAQSILGGGDTASAVRELNLAEQMSHISTGGGASLKLLEGKKLPGVEAIEEIDE